MTGTTPGKFRRLNNAEWLASRYRLAGDRTIAAEVGCSEATVRRARQKLGIVSFRPGPRSTTELPIQTATSDFERRSIAHSELIPGITQLAHHVNADQASPPSEELLIGRCQAWLDARRHHDQHASQDALLSIASAALLIHEHQIKLRKARK